MLFSRGAPDYLRKPFLETLNNIADEIGQKEGKEYSIDFKRLRKMKNGKSYFYYAKPKGLLNFRVNLSPLKISGLYNCSNNSAEIEVKTEKRYQPLVRKNLEELFVWLGIKDVDISF